MNSLIGFLLLALAGSALLEDVTLFDPCDKDDATCLATATQNFLEKSYQGLPDYDIKQIDPLIIPSLEVDVDETIKLMFSFQNLTVIGLRHQKLYDIDMNTIKNSVLFSTKVDLNVFGDVTVVSTNTSNTLSGVLWAMTTALGTMKYSYSLKTNNKNDLEYFDVGPEANITCEIIGQPIVTLVQTFQPFQSVLSSGAAKIKSDYEAHKDTLNMLILCKIVEEAYVTVLHNIRASAKILPISAFFKDF